MTDISDLREGDEIEVVLRLRRDDRLGFIVPGSVPFAFYGDRIIDHATAVSVVRPEIIPGQPYVDADGKLYVGKSGDRVVHVNDEGIGVYYHASHAEHRPLPHGLRPAKVVPES